MEAQLCSYSTLWNLDHTSAQLRPHVDHTSVQSLILCLSRNMDVEDKSVEVDFEWMKNLVSEGKTRDHNRAEESSSTSKFLLIDVRRLAHS